MGTDDGDVCVRQAARRSLEDSDVDPDALLDALDRHPVRLAVLFGSYAKGTRHDDSDVDIAVEFEESAELEEAFLPLVSDLSSVTGETHVDVGVLQNMDPRVGVAVCRNGVRLVGERDRLEYYCRQFRDELRDTERRPARDRFHEIVETAKRAVESDA